MGLAVLIERDGYRVESDGAIVKQRDLAALHDVSDAFALAERRLRDREAAHEAECADRVIDGYRQGLERGAREAAEHLAVAEIRREALLEAIRPALAELVMEAVALIARDVDRETLIRQALDGLHGLIRDASWARLRVHPQAQSAAQRALDAIVRDSGVGALARVVVDAKLPVDGCVFESEFGKVDASLAVQLAAIQGAVRRAAPALVDELRRSTSAAAAT